MPSITGFEETALQRRQLWGNIREDGEQFRKWKHKSLRWTQLAALLLYFQPVSSSSTAAVCQRPPDIHCLTSSIHPVTPPSPAASRPTHCVAVDSSLPPMVPGVVQRGSGPSTSSSTGENNLRLGSQPPAPPMARRRKASGKLWGS